MKSNISFISRSALLSIAVVFLMLVATIKVSAQATCSTPSNIANFGVDGDVNANTPAAIMGDSWFYSNVYPGTGIGVIGTTAATAVPAISAAAFKAIIQGATSQQGRNRTYAQRMSVPPLSQINGMTLIDAFSARDNISPDSTAFTGSNKNGDNPSIWSVGLTSVPNKNDIIDVGGHLRRQTTGATSLNDLWMYTYVTRLATGGDAYTDIEIYRTVPYLNTATGKLMNTGPASTGGHTVFTFNSSAGIANPGDIILCVNYNSSGGVASARIWCNINNLDGNNNGIAWFNAQPGRPFNFTGDFITGTNANGYGYAEIQSLSGASCLISSVLNSANTPAGEWGNLTGSSAVFDTNIEPEQLVNIAFNFTDMGLDFAFLAGPCYNVFGALWFKTRSSSSYSSELKDACGPFTFGNFSEIQANAGPDKLLTCSTTQTILNGSSATQGAIINWYTPNGNIVSGANTATPTVNMAGMYIISAQNPGLSSCIATDTVYVTNDVTIPNANAGPDKQITCSASTISLSGSSSTPGIQFSWQALSGGNIVSGSNSAAPVVNAAGCYVLTVTNPSNGCSRTDTSCVSMNVGIPVIGSVSQVNVNCFAVCSGILNLSVSGGQAPYTYNWSNGAATPSLSNLCAGNYSVTVSGSNGCTIIGNYTITQPGATLAASVNGVTNVACFGQNSGAINLNTSGGTLPYSYSWSNGATSQNLSGIASGVYTVTVTDANGCTAVVAGITVSSAVSALSASLSAVSNVSCFNGNDGSIALSVSGGTVPYTYSWSNGATSQNINNLAAGTYSVTVTDDNGCAALLSSIISQPSAAVVSSIGSSQNVSCFGGNNGSLNLTVSGGTSPYIYVWNNGATTQDISSLTSGTYTVTVTDAQGCTSVSTAAITQPVSALSASINASQNISCYSGNNGSIDLNVQGGTSPYSYNWSNGATTQDISGLGEGVYTVNVTDSKGCVASQTVTLTEPAAALSGTAAVTQQVSCFGGVNGSINLSVSGGTVPYSFVWSNGNASEDLSGLGAGIYTVTVTDVKGCTLIRSATITQPSAALSATASQTQAVSCNSGNDGQISLVVTGGTAPYSFNWSNGASTQSISNLSAGTYNVTVTDINGCTDISSATITQPALALSGSTTTTSNISCFSGNNGSIDLTVAGGTAPYIYNWSTGASTQDLTSLSAGSYSVTITDANGCSAGATGTISQPAGALSTNINISQNIPCYGGGSGSIDLSVSGGTTPYQYAWSNGASSQDISGLSAGTYTVTISDANGCNTSASVSITQPSAPLSASISSVQPVLCFGGTNGSLDLNVSGGTFPYNYSWSNGQTTQQILNLSAGIYTVIVTDANGCTVTKSGTIVQPASALSSTALITQQVSCYGGNNGAVNVTTSGGTAPYNFSWSNGSTNEDLTGLSSGTYTLNIVDANGCAATQSITITQPVAALNANASSTQAVSCYGGNNGAATVVATGGTTPYTYSWSNGAFTQSISSVPSGTYIVTVTDANGCTEISSVAIIQPAAALSAIAGISQQVSCFGGSSGSINLAVSGGTVPYSFLWSNGAVTQNLSNVVSGTYTVTVTDANGCFTTQTRTITQPAAALNGSASVSQNVSCFGGANGSISLNVSGGTLPYSYNWNNGATTQNLNGLSSGNYTVIITDFNGCTASSSATISQPAAGLSLNAGSISNVSCFGGTNGSINSTATGGTSPYSYSWSNGASTQNISGLGSGTYTVTVTDGNGCSASQTAGITQPVAELNLTVSYIQPVLCFNGNTGGVNVTVSGGTAPYTYNWSNGASTQNLTGITSGNYTLTVTDANGCTDIQSVNITQPAAALNSSLAVLQNVSCFGGDNGALSLSVSGGTAPYSYLWNTGAFTQNISGLTSGTYTVTITDVNGCTTNASATISQPNATLSTVISTGQNVSCFGGNNGSINLSANGGTAPYNFVWNTGSVSQNISGLISGNYSVTVTDANGCTTANSATISQPFEGLSAGISISQNVSCFGGNNGSVDLFVSGGTVPYTYVWSNGAFTQDISSLSAGTYMVTITDANGCTHLQSGSVSQPSAALSASGVSSQNVSCFGGNNGAINLTVSGGTLPYSYVWSNGITTQDMGSLPAGTYNVTVTDANGCIANTSVTVTQPLAALSATITSSQNVNCFGGNTGSVNLTVANGTAPYTYNWSNGSTTQDLSGLGAGTYSVTVTDANGCISAQSVTITQPTAALASSATIDQNVSCFGGTNGSVNLTVTGGTTPYTYSWSNGQTTQDMSGLAAGNYTVTVTDANGCTTTRTITITQPTAALSATATQSQAVSCNAGNDGQISLAVTGGTAPYTYVWSNGQTTQAINGLSAGTYTVTVTDANGCTKIATATITQPANALSGSTTTTSNISCFSGNNGSIDLTVAGGTAPYTYMWSNGAITQDLTGLPAGSYSVTITDANGCVATSSGIITQPAGSLAANLNVSQNVNCFGGGNGALDLTVSGGTTPYTYTWSTGATTEDISGLAVGFYTVSITDANGCISSATGAITQPSAALSSTISTSQNVNCFGGNNGALDLTVNGGTAPYSYNWSNGATSQDINNLLTGTYTVTITDANGCITTQTGSVSQPAAALNATVSASANVSCYGGGNGSVNLTVTGGTAPYSYSWSNGQTTEDINGLSAGTYTANITDVNGCNTSASVTITEPSAAVSITINSTTAISCFGGYDGQAAITANGGTAPYTYLWNTGATTAALNGLATGTYTVTVTDVNGCSESTSVTLTQPSAALSSTISTSQNVNCFGGNNGALDLTVNGGTAPYSYNWSNGATSQDINNLLTGTYTVTITDANGCITTQTGSVSQPAAALNATVSASANVSCYGGGNGSVNLTVTGGTAPYSYSWSNGQTTEDISGLSAGTYTANITDVNGCNTTASVTITEPSAAVSITINSTTAISCFGGNDGQAAITANGGTAPYTYLWNTGATTAAVSGLATGTYTVTVTDINGCSQSTSVTLSQPVAPLAASVSVGQNVSCFGGNNGTADLTVNGGTLPYTFVWNTGAVTEDVSGLSSGTYTVTVTDFNNCIASQTIIISQPAAALSGSAVVTGNISCFSGNNGSIDLTPAGGTAPYNFQWNTGASTEDVNGLGAGIYTVTISDINGCTAITNAEVTQPAGSLAAVLSVNQNVLCFAGNSGSLDLTVSFGTAPYTYLWNTGATTEDISGLTSGMYTVSITDANGCITSQSAFISQPLASLNAQAATVQPVLCYAGSDGSIDINVTGGTAPYSFIWSNGAISEDINNLSSGTYTVNITDVNGCTFILTESINQPASALASIASVMQNVQCNNGNDGSVSVQASGGTAPYIYSWSNGEVTSAVTGLSSGWYFVTIADLNGCSVSDSIEVTQPVAALASVTSVTQNVQCNNGNDGSVSVQASGGTAPYNYLWSNGEITSAISGLSSGWYYVTITDANGCTVSDAVEVTQPFAALASNLNSTQNVNCFGGNNGNIDLNVSGGTMPYSFVWSNGAITEDIGSLVAGTYTVSVTDANGCSLNASVTITEPSAALNPVVSVLQNINCFGDETGIIDLTVTGGTSPYTYVWSNGATTEDLSLLFAGTYTVTVTDANGCTETGQANITQPSAPLITNINVISNVFCNGGATGSLDLVVNGGTAPYTYLWSNGMTTEDISNLVTGNYSVTITDANGCTSIATAGVGQPGQQLSAAVTVQNVLCFNGNNGYINITPSGGTSPYSFLWNTGAVTEDIGGLVAGTYTVSITDANGCDTVITAAIIQPSAPLIPALTIAQNVSCFGGNDGSISLAVTGGTLPYVYLWSNGSTTTGISGLPAGSYTVTVTDANGCNAIISDFVSQPAAPLETPVIVSQQVSCFGGSDGALTTNATGGTAPYSYLWNTGATTSGITGLPAGPYTVTVTDANGCTYTATAQITQPIAPLAITGTTTIANCLNGVGGTITIQVTGGTPMYSYLWSNGATTQNISNAMPGSYTVTVTDANGCVVNGTYIVDNSSDFNLTAGPTTICVGEFATLMADPIPGATYQWYFQGNVLNGATGLTFNTPAAGYYYVTATVPCGTFYSDSIEVIVKSIENASISSNRIICPPETVQLLATGGVTYEWSPTNFMTFSNVPDPIVNPPVSTTYSVLVTNEWGCKVTMDVDITVACDTLFIPNGFSPNDDGTNDGFVIDGIENYPGNKLWVYNRWGNLVFKTKDYDNHWDGVSNVSGIYIGKKVPTGTYYFILDLNDNSKPRAGYLIIRR